MPKTSKNWCNLLDFFCILGFVSKLSTFKKPDFLLLKVTLPPYYETLLKDKFQQCNAIYKNKAPKVILLTYRRTFAIFDVLNVTINVNINPIIPNNEQIPSIISFVPKNFKKSIIIEITSFQPIAHSE